MGVTQYERREDTMKQDADVEKGLERARSLTLARIVGRGKRVRPTQVTVMPDGKVRVEVHYFSPPGQQL
jgi:hypothetical protein